MDAHLWIFIAMMAAGFQTLRFMVQKSLSMGALSSGGATLARFLFAAPFVAAMVLAYSTVQEVKLPVLGAMFWPFALAGALAQILATWCVVALFQHRNFAVGITFKKTEVMQTALVGFLVLGDRISLGGFGAIAIGLIGVLVLSGRPEGGGFLNKGAGLGLLSGAFFAVSAVGYRGATLEVGSDDPLLRAMVSLMFVTASQSLGLSLFLRWREPGEVTRVLASWRQSVWMGLAGLGGSLGWFWAFTLQNAAYVFAIGQVEVIFSILVSTLVFKEKITLRETSGIALITLSVLTLVLFL
jgi:drug/metabolite transporter (DMT)-like permease